MAVVTMAQGYDLGYVWKSQGAGEKTTGGYYINAAQQGEAPGRWSGRGAQALGFSPGQVVERAPYEQVYRQADPRTGEKLGQSPARYTTFDQHFSRLTAAEPEATAGRVLELERLAAAATRKTPAYHDITVSLPKSVSAFHASIRENERQARLAGDLPAVAHWAAAEARYQEIVQDANAAGMAHLQEHAGVTRTGGRSVRVDGTDTGRYETTGLVITSWLQGTSRDGDPQDHVHNQIARVSRTDADGKWRAVDSVALRGQLGAVDAIVSARTEAALSREFGVEWAPRADGKGREINGISREQIESYSSRTAAIDGATEDAIGAWAQRHGRAPNRREVLFIKQEVTMTTRAGKESGAIDWDALAARWDATLGGALARIAPEVSDLGPRGAAAPRRNSPGGAPPDRAAQIRAMDRALAAVQKTDATWTRAALMREVAVALPDQARAMTPDAAHALLEKLTSDALAGAAAPVTRVDAPEYPAVPDVLRRASDRRSVYTRPGTERYATGVQMSLEGRLLAAARREGAPAMSREQVAAALGADPDELARQLGVRAQESRAPLPSGLRLDQAAALQHGLTSPRTAVVMVGPAGSGKTRTLAEAARIWPGPVVGVTPSQASRNVLAGAGVPQVWNFAQFLGHLPGERGALGIRPVEPGTLIVVDEGGMMSTPDTADIVEHAAAAGAKVVVAGDQEQLAAVESGGAMMLLASQLGHVQLAEPVRFKAEWEREASLRLRAGDPAVIDVYNQHGRIYGGPLHQVQAEARQAYVAAYLAGRDALLMCKDWATCQEMSRQIRDDLIHLGKVEGGEEVTLGAGVKASAGDLIVVHSNDHRLVVDGPKADGGELRTLANGDTLRIDSVHGDHVTARLLLDADPVTGERVTAERSFTFRDLANSDLAYVVTAHTAQGRTVHTGMSLTRGGEDRQWFYVANSRGTDDNRMFAGTVTREADPRSGTQAAPEIRRAERVAAERAATVTAEEAAEDRLLTLAEDRHGSLRNIQLTDVHKIARSLAAEAGLPGERAHEVLHEAVMERDPRGVLADVLARDSAQVSATETRERSLANADHLASLAAVFDGETRAARNAGYEKALREVLPGQHAGTGLSSHATWLWRSVRSAETAGRDARAVLERAVNQRNLDGVRDLAAVLDARVREQTAGLVPARAGSQAEHVPHIADPQRRDYAQRVAAAMDARKERLGEHTANTAPAWAVRALGPVPEAGAERDAWQQRAASVAAYREQHGYEHPLEAIGPEPVNSPEARQGWHEAFAALGPVEGTDLRAASAGQLHLMRATYEAETAWAPRHAGESLRQVRLAAAESSQAAIRADAEAAIAAERDEHELAATHAAAADSARAAELAHREQESILAAAQEDRDKWEAFTEPARRLAVAADSELRHRDPDAELPLLRSAEPQPPDQDERDRLIPDGPGYEKPAWLDDMAARGGQARETIADRQSERIPHEEDHEWEDEQAWPDQLRTERDAILQPPREHIRPAPEAEAAASDRERDTGGEPDREPGEPDGEPDRQHDAPGHDRDDPGAEPGAGPDEADAEPELE